MTQPIAIGSAQHKELFCRAFIDSHRPYDPTRLEWPALDADNVARLRAMPFWHEAIATESDVARKVQALAPRESDPLVREAIALQGQEEARHAQLLGCMLAHYEIPTPPVAETPLPPDAEWGFIRVGYGECFDSFFAFGLYMLAREAEMFPRPLLDVVEPIVDEEARHILFFVNWIAYRRARQPWLRRPFDHGRCALAMAMQVWTRIQTARGAQDDDFMLGVSDSLALDASPGQVLALCLSEHDRRLAPYDPRLLRPRLVPAIARLLCRVLR